MEPYVILPIVPPQLLLRGSSEIMPHETSGLKRASTWGTSAGKYL